MLKLRERMATLYYLTCSCAPLTAAVGTQLVNNAVPALRTWASTV